MQLDEAPSHLKIVQEMCNYRSVATKKLTLTFTFSCIVHLLVINKNIQALAMGRDVTKSVGRVVAHMLSFILFCKRN